MRKDTIDGERVMLLFRLMMRAEAFNGTTWQEAVGVTFDLAPNESATVCRRFGVDPSRKTHGRSKL